MKYRYLCASALIALSTTASADSVVLYGIIDSGVEYISNVGAKKSNELRMPSLSGSLPSRWGIKGSEDLGNGLKATFVLEAGFAPNQGTSNQGGRHFGRQATVGLAGPWGEVKLGRQYSMLFMAYLPVDAMGGSIHSLGNLDTFIPNARIDNSISYMGTFDGLTVGAMYGRGYNVFGTNECPGQVSETGNCRHMSFMLQYERNGYGIVAAYDAARGGPDPFFTLGSHNSTDKRSYVGAYGKISDTHVGVGWIHRSHNAARNFKSNLVFGSVSHPVTRSLTVDGGISYITYQNSPDQATLYAARATYALSRRTAAYITAAYMNNGGDLNASVSGGSITGANPVPGGSQMGTMIGLRHFF